MSLQVHWYILSHPPYFVYTPAIDPSNEKEVAYFDLGYQ